MNFRQISLTVFLLSVSAFSQVSSDQNQACNAEFVQVLIQQQIAESGTVEQTDKRIRIYLRSADFLWKLDEPTARKYFADALKIANERFAEKGFEKKKNDNDKGFGFVAYEPDYRLEVIRAIAKRDGDWAKKLSEQILADYEKSLKDRTDEFDKTREIGELLQIAKDNLKANPNLSWFIFRRLMRYPLDYYWYFALYSVAEENQQIAAALYAELLQNYADQTPRRLLFLSAYPFVRPRIFGVDKFSYGINISANIVPNPNLQKQFIQTFLRRVNSFAANPDDRNRPAEKYRAAESVYIISALSEIEPLVNRNFPDLTQRFAETKAQANALLTEENRQDLEKRQKNSESFGNNFEQRLKIVEDADEKGKLTDKMIIDLILGAKTEDEFKQAESWSDKIKNETVRRDSANYLFFLRSKLAIKENRFDDARRFADIVPELEHRAILYFEMAEMQLKDTNETARTFDILNNVSKIADEAENSVAKAQVLLGLANMYEKVNHTVALSKLTEAVRVINQLENPDIFSTSVYRHIIIPNEFAFYAGYSTPGYNLETAFEEISKKDFELSLSNARGLNDKYFRTLAILATVKNCVQKKPKKQTPAK